MATIRKKGDLQWHVQVRRKHITETKTFTTKHDAEAWARDVEGKIDRGVYVSRIEAESTTVADVCDRYSREVLPRLKGKTPDASRLKTIKTKLGKLPIAAITSAILATYRDERLLEVGKQSVIHELGLINRVLKTCVIDWGIALPSGIPLVRKPQKPEGRSRRPSDTEIDAICEATESAELSLIMRIGLETTLRRSEIIKLKYKDVDLSVPCLNLYDTKNSTSRQVPLSKKAIAIIKSLPLRLNGKLFSIQPDSVTRAFKRALIRAKKKYISAQLNENKEPKADFLENLHFHDLRHEATSRIAEKVSNLIELASITGHKDLQMLKRYYHPKVEDLAKKLG
ncbi:MAG: integrase [Methylotenera sp.]|nr:MAG: integrase [Methylotenera sp.]